MKKRKSVIVSIVMVLILSLVLTSCSDSDDKKQKETPKPTATPEVTQEPTPEPTDTPEPTATPEPADVYDEPDFFTKAEITVEGFQDDPNEYHPPEDMVDGDPDTRWSLRKFPTEVVFNFGAPFVLSKLDITWASGNGRIFFYEVYVSLDGENYELVVDRNANEDVGLTTDDMEGVLARYLKLFIVNNSINNGWCSVHEVVLEGFRFGKNPYNVDFANKKITIPESVSVEEFIENCNLGGLYEASVEGATDKVENGNKLVIKCGEAEFKYDIVVG